MERKTKVADTRGWGSRNSLAFKTMDCPLVTCIVKMRPRRRRRRMGRRRRRERRRRRRRSGE